MTAALLLSGGMDSIAIAWWRRPQIAITIDYGQAPAAAEIRAAAAVTADLGIEHVIITADLSALGSGDLAGAAPMAIAPVREWWPYRNQMLVTLAAMKAIALGLDTILIGCLRTDEAHTDGTTAFVDQIDRLLTLQEGGLRLQAPAIGLDAVELIKASGVPPEVLAWAHSCHVGEHSCGYCRGCRKHFDTTAALGLEPY